MAKATIIPYSALKHQLDTVRTASKLYSLIANAPFAYKVETAFLFLGFICFYLVDTEQEQVYLAGVSDTEQYRLAVQDIEFKASEYRIALSNRKNSIVKAITSGKPVITTDWETLSRPTTTTGIARLNQATSGIANSQLYPLTGDRQGALMYNFFQYSEYMGEEQQQFMERYTTLVSDALDALTAKTKIKV